MEETKKESLSIVKSGRVSYNALDTLGGRIVEECNRDLQYPYCIRTYKNMFKDATIAPAMAIMEMSIASVPWEVKIPKGHKEALKDKAKFLEEVMNDMDITWSEFIRRASTINKFGHAPIEKVYRKRLLKNGSRFNDGLYGLRDLPLIAQDSIDSWEWEDKGRTIKGLNQLKIVPQGKNETSPILEGDGTIFIRRGKFLLFRTGADKDNPLGVSPLDAVYMAWRYKIEYEKHEAQGVANDLRGLKVIHIPMEYLDENASEGEKATREYFEKVLRGMHSGEQTGVLMPSAYDEKGNKLFDFDLKSVMGQMAHDTNSIINRYRREIVTGILAPHLILGQEGGGSFALAESLEDITKLVITDRLSEIRDQINHDLIPQLFAINGWDTSITPYFDFAEVDTTSLEDFSKAVQRTAAVGSLVLDAPTINKIHKKLDLPIPFEDEEISMEDVREFTTDFTSKSGTGMEVGTVGEGQAKSLSGDDTSISNLENV